MPTNSPFYRPNKCTLLTVGVLCVVIGCSTWHTQESTGVPKLPQPQMSRDSVGIEMATVTLSYDQGRELKEIMRALDEQIMPAQQRRHLANNGIRAGVFGTQLPNSVHLLLLEAAHRREHPTTATFGAEHDEQRFIQCRSGRRNSTKIWGAVGKVDVDHFDGNTTLRETLNDASCQIAMRCVPQGSRGAMIKLTPEIEHGPLRQKFVAEGGSFHLETLRDRVVYDDLTIEFTLRAGETAMVTCSEAESGVGQSLFRNSESTRQKALLIRLAQTQPDEMFAKEKDI